MKSQFRSSNDHTILLIFCLYFFLLLSEPSSLYEIANVFFCLGTNPTSIMPRAFLVKKIKSQVNYQKKWTNTDTAPLFDEALCNYAGILPQLSKLLILLILLFYYYYFFFDFQMTVKIL